MINEKNYESLVHILKEDKRFFTEDGVLLRNVVYNAAMQMDSNLLKILFKNEITKEMFFKNIDDIYVFDKVGFGWTINNRNFLPDSYTRFKNKIGLAKSNEDLLLNNGEVVLAFPYKDCILEGGQTKEDQKRVEIFYNETLAPSEINRLLYPKVFVNAKRYSLAGEEIATHFDKNDNLIIKGNNLLTISSLLKRYENQVKCIYIDVPYNTGNDSFGYNDKFNHSSWLTFMKNRLEIAHKLLREDGTIAISVDNYELGYLLVLLDEIFGKNNRKNIITVRRASVSGPKVINPGVVNIAEYVVLYSKNTDIWRPNRVLVGKAYDTRYNQFILNYDAGYEKWDFTPVSTAFASSYGCTSRKLKSELGNEYDKKLEEFVIENAKKVCQFVNPDDSQISQDAKKLKQISLDNPTNIYYMERENKSPYYFKNGHLILFAIDRLVNIDGKLSFGQPISDIWDDVLPNDLHNEGGITFKKGKKPEKLLSRIIELCTNENDLVIDFFAGSGTTGAVCHKMKRQYVLCEQLDYIETITKSRLINVINGDTRGATAMVNWKGGGSFIYCELAELNSKFIKEIHVAKEQGTLQEIYERILNSGYINCAVDPTLINPDAEDFKDLNFEERKNLLLEILDKNMLYVNYCDIDDSDYNISDVDKLFTHSFYKRGE